MSSSAVSPSGAMPQSSGVDSSTASSVAASSPEISTAATSAAPTSSAASSEATAESTASSAPSTPSRPEGTISGSGGTIKAGAGLKLPAKLDNWVKAAGSGSVTIYSNGNSQIGVSFLAGADYAGMAENVSRSRTKIGSGVCGSTEDRDNLLCYLKTADGVLSLSATKLDTPLVALGDFANELTKNLGRT